MRALFLGLALSTAIALPASAAELLVNGNFETGTYAGWSANVRPGSNGSLYISTPGANAPQSGLSTAGNAMGGRFYSVTDQGGSGSYSLTQSFVVPNATTSLSLSFQMFANNYAGVVFVDPAGLDHNVSPNQHARVDILLASAAAFTNNPSDIVANFFLGADAGSNPTPYTNYAFNLAGLLTAGQTYQIRFGEVDNQLFFNQGVDNVSILAAGGVPEPTSWALMIAGFGLVGGVMRRRAGTPALA